MKKRIFPERRTESSNTYSNSNIPSRRRFEMLSLEHLSRQGPVLRKVDQEQLSSLTDSIVYRTSLTDFYGVHASHPDFAFFYRMLEDLEELGEGWYLALSMIQSPGKPEAPPECGILPLAVLGS